MSVVRKKRRNHKVKDYAFVSIIVLMTLVLMLEAVRLLQIKNHIAEHQVKKVVSTYELKRIRTSKNTSYQFILPNGDRLSFIGDPIANIKLIESQERLLFTYASPRGGIRFTYVCVEITSVDGKTCFVNREVALRDITWFMWFYFVISGFLAFLWLNGGLVILNTPKGILGGSKNVM